MSVELPDGWSAWTRDGEPVRRVGTNGNEINDAAFADDMDPQLAVEAVRDTLIYGDAFATLDGKRVSPFDVNIMGPLDMKAAPFRPADYPRAPWDAPDDPKANSSAAGLDNADG